MSRLAIAVVAAVFLAAAAPAAAQRTAVPRPPGHAAAPPQVAVRGEAVFIGGYYYDPYYGRYPWWPRPVHFPRYFPAYDYRAEVRVMAEPKQTAVYVDGYYAGIVDDFDGVFQRLLLPPGGHEFTLYLASYRTARYTLYVQPGSSMNLHHVMAPLGAGEVSDVPVAGTPIPPPPDGTYRMPRTPPPIRARQTPPDARAYGVLSLRVQPADAVVMVDGERWLSADSHCFVIDVVEGRHHLEVTKDGYLRFSTDFDVREGQSMPMNVALPPQRPENEGGSR
jgi:hypothetical protein